MAIRRTAIRYMQRKHFHPTHAVLPRFRCWGVKSHTRPLHRTVVPPTDNPGTVAGNTPAWPPQVGLPTP